MCVLLLTLQVVMSSGDNLFVCVSVYIRIFIFGGALKGAWIFVFPLFFRYAKELVKAQKQTHSEYHAAILMITVL